MFALIYLLVAAAALPEEGETKPSSTPQKECTECPEERASDIDKDQDDSNLWEIDNEQG